MVHLKNVGVYTPRDAPEELVSSGVMFFRSEDGQDFYEAIKQMKEDTMKVLYVDGIVTGFSHDASSLYPLGASLIEIPADNVPEDLELGRKYLFNPKTLKFKINPDFLTRNLDIQKQNLLALANDKIAQYQDKLDLETATPGEISALKNWKAYRVKVREAQDVGSLPKQPRV